MNTFDNFYQSVCQSQRENQHILVKFKAERSIYVIVEVRSALSHSREGWDRCRARMWTIENKRLDRQAKSSFPSVHVYVFGRGEVSPLTSALSFLTFDIGLGSSFSQWRGWSLL